MNILVIDIGGTNVKMLASGHETPRKFPSGLKITAKQMVAGVLAATKDWDYKVISIGFPGPVLCGQPMTEPVNLGPGWMGFDFEAAFGRPVKVINDAAMQALGSYQGGKMLFLGLGTGFGAAVIMDGVLEPLELGRFHYKKRTLEYYVGDRGRKRQGRKKWQREVEETVARLIDALKPDDVVLGGGNAKKLKPLPPRTRLGDNALAFLGGFRMWEPQTKPRSPSLSENGTAQPDAGEQQPKRRSRGPLRTDAQEE
ncbi:MAG TPA: ROK family protein [Gemmataceae bacterium]|nr:ROK family protein [Gemmataceae bacterium]